MVGERAEARPLPFLGDDRDSFTRSECKVAAINHISQRVSPAGSRVLPSSQVRHQKQEISLPSPGGFLVDWCELLCNDSAMTYPRSHFGL